MLDSVYVQKVKLFIKEAEIFLSKTELVLRIVETNLMLLNVGKFIFWWLNTNSFVFSNLNNAH